MTLFFLGVFAAITLYTAAAKKDFFSPVRLFIIAYSFYLAINSLGLSRLQSPWSTITNLFFWGSVFVFAGCGAIILILDRAKGGVELDFGNMRAALQADSESLDWKWFWWIFIGSAAYFIVAYFGAAALYGTIPMLADDPDAARVKYFGISLPTSIGLFFGPLSLMLGTELLLFGKVARGQKVFAVFLMAVVFFFYLSIAMRLDLFRFGIFGLILYHYGRRRLGLKEFLLAALVGIILFVAIYLMRVHSDAVGQLNEIAKVRMPRRYMWASQIYAYVVSNFWNMDYGFTRYVEELGSYPMSWGFELFRPVMFILRLEGSMQVAYGFDSIFNDSVNYVKGMNSTVYLWHFWKDFGAVGVYGLSMAAGLALSIFYVNTGRAPTLFRLSLWGLFAGVIVFSITAALWEFWFTWLNVLVLAVAHRKLRAL